MGCLPGKIQQLDTSKMSHVLEDCYKHVWKKYELLAERSKSQDGERDYDSLAKGPHLLKSLHGELRRRLNKKVKK